MISKDHGWKIRHTQSSSFLPAPTLLFPGRIITQQKPYLLHPTHFNPHLCLAEITISHAKIHHILLLLLLSHQTVL